MIKAGDKVRLMCGGSTQWVVVAVIQDNVLVASNYARADGLRTTFAIHLAKCTKVEPKAKPGVVYSDVRYPGGCEFVGLANGQLYDPRCKIAVDIDPELHKEITL